MKSKFPSSIVILVILIGLATILTWIIPQGKFVEKGSNLQALYSNEINDKVFIKLDEERKLGLMDVLAAPVAGMFQAYDIIFYTLVMGGLMGVVTKSGAFTSGVADLVRRLRGREIQMIPLLMIAFAIAGTTFGFFEEAIIFYPILYPILISSGFDPVVCVAVVVLGTGVGCAASTVNPFATGIASNLAGIPIGEGLPVRALMLLVMLILAIVIVMIYARRVQQNPTKSVLYGATVRSFLDNLPRRRETRFTGRHRAILIMLLIAIIFLIMGVIPWKEKYDINTFTNAYNTLANIKVFNVGILGLEPTTANFYQDHYQMYPTHSAPFGYWDLGQLSVLFFVIAMISGLIAGSDLDRVIENFIEGAKDMLSISLLIAFARGVSVIFQTGNINATIINWAEGLIGSMPPAVYIILIFIIYFLFSFFVPSSTGLASFTIPIFAPITANVFVHGSSTILLGLSLLVTAFQTASGLVNMIAPTSVLLSGSLKMANIPYGKWMRFVWQAMLGFVVVTLFFLVGTIVIG